MRHYSLYDHSGLPSSHVCLSSSLSSTSLFFSVFSTFSKRTSKRVLITSNLRFAAWCF